MRVTRLARLSALVGGIGSFGAVRLWIDAELDELIGRLSPCVATSLPAMLGNLDPLPHAAAASPATSLGDCTLLSIPLSATT